MNLLKDFKYITRPENTWQIPYRVLSTLTVKAIAGTSITPNQVTALRGAVVVVSLVLFALGDPHSLLWAVGLFFVFEVLDHVDGDLARYTRKFSATGPLLEQFIDTWSARPSNIFGLCVAIGMYRQTGHFDGYILWAATALGRLLWLEYRDYFGWVRSDKGEEKKYDSIFNASAWRLAVLKFFDMLYTWNNLFLLAGAALQIPVRKLAGIDALTTGFVVVAVLNHLPWMLLVARGFFQASKYKEKSK
jgi:phosphatidylglycerophosphate synthase